MPGIIGYRLATLSHPAPKLIVSTGYQCVPPDPDEPACPATSGTDQGAGQSPGVSPVAGGVPVIGG